MFVFDTALGVTNIDSIAGFASGTDHIQLALAMFGGIGVTGALSATAFASGAGMTSASNADQHVIRQVRYIMMRTVQAVGPLWLLQL